MCTDRYTLLHYQKGYTLNKKEDKLEKLVYDHEATMRPFVFSFVSS